MSDGRDMVAAIESVLDMDDERIRLFAKRDPDIFRDVARIARQSIMLEKFGNPPCPDCWPNGRCTMNCSGASLKKWLRSYPHP